MKTTISYTNINCPICRAPQADLEALTAHLILTHEIADPKSSTTTPNSNRSILSVATRRHRRQLRRTAATLDALAQQVLMASHLATLENVSTPDDEEETLIDLKLTKAQIKHLLRPGADFEVTEQTEELTSTNLLEVTELPSFAKAAKTRTFTVTINADDEAALLEALEN